MQRMNDPFPIDPTLLESSRPPSTAPQLSRPPSNTWSLTSTVSSIRRASSPQPQSISDWGSTSTEDSEFLRKRVQQLEASLDDQDCKVSYLEQKIERQGALLKRLLQDSGWDADVEDGLEETAQRPRKRNNKAAAQDPDDINKILMDGKVKRLTDRQKKVRKDLLVFATVKLKYITGTEPTSNIPPPDLQPGDHVLPDGRHITVPNFKKDVTDEINSSLTRHAAKLVYDEQSNERTRNLHFNNVPFTEVDVDEITKKAFKNWKTAYERKTDVQKAAKLVQTHKRTAQTQHRRQKKSDRLEMAEEYLITHGADPTPLLLTDWMLDYVSELEDGDENAKMFHCGQMVAEAGLTHVSHVDKELIWERVCPAFRSDEVNEVYKTLDMIREQKIDSTKKKATARRVDLHRVHNWVSVLSPYPFMVSEAWHGQFVAGKQLDRSFATRREDPPGFGSKKDMRVSQFDEY